MTEPGPHAMPRLTCLFLLCVVSAAPVASATAQVRGPEAAQDAQASASDAPILQGTQVKLIAVRSIDRLEYFRSKPIY